MIPELIARFDAKRTDLLAAFRAKHPDSYKEVVKILVKHITSDAGDEFNLDPKRITCIDHGDYQGTQVYIIGAKGYQPSKYWATKVSYGSCSGCDTLQAIRGYGSSKPTAKQAKSYLTLALHLIQKMEEVCGEKK